MRAAAFSLLFLTAVAAPSAARQAPAAPPKPKVLRVPAQFASVQAAIDTARPGDTVLVAPGRYYENLQLRGRNLVLTSEYALRGDRGLIGRTILDGSRPRAADTASVLIIDGGEDSTTVIQGFTITGGNGTRWLDPRHKLWYREGGGILCEFSSPIIQHNVIEGNAATSMEDSVASAGGGGIRCGFGEPTIRYNVIRNNRGRYGAGMTLFHAAARVQHNLITGNTGGEDFGGSGIWAIGSLSRLATHLIEHNTIAGNVSTAADSTGPRGLGGRGGGLVLIATPTIVRRNIIWGNRQVEAQVAVAPRGTPTFEHNVVEGGLRFVDGRTVPSTGTLEQSPEFGDAVTYQPSPRSAAAKLGAYGGEGAPARLP